MTLDFRCDICQKPVWDGDGWVTLDLNAVRQVEQAWTAFEQDQPTGWHAVDLGRLFELPDPTAWHVYHRACDPDLGGDTYWFDIDRIRAISQVLDWWLHLTGKRWFKHTDWARFVRDRVQPQLDKTEHSA